MNGYFSVFGFIKFLFLCSWARLCVGGDDSTSTQTTVHNNDNRQVNTNTTSFDSHNVQVLDGGAIQGIVDTARLAITGANTATAQGYDYADHIFDGATAALNQAGLREANAYDAAGRIALDGLHAAQSGYQTALNGLGAAYADAKGTTAAQSNIILAVLAVCGLLVLRKG